MRFWRRVFNEAAFECQLDLFLVVSTILNSSVSLTRRREGSRLLTGQVVRRVKPSGTERLDASSAFGRQEMFADGIGPPITRTFALQISYKDAFGAERVEHIALGWWRGLVEAFNCRFHFRFRSYLLEFLFDELKLRLWDFVCADVRVFHDAACLLAISSSWLRSG